MKTFMKLGIGSYYYHGFFSEVDRMQKPAARSYTTDSFIDRVKAPRCDGLSMELPFFPKCGAQ